MAFTESQQLLTLAALTYRGYADIGSPRFREAHLHQVVERGLQSLPPLAGQWTLAWGPVAYRAPLSLFADAAMYVARNTLDPSWYVVAIRGTNPISAFDWLFGDLWVSRQVPWQFDPGQSARISLSTALGLDILLTLRPTAPSRGAPEAPATTPSATPLPPGESKAMRPVPDRLAQAFQSLLAKPAVHPDANPAGPIAALVSAWQDDGQLTLMARVAAGLQALGSRASTGLLHLAHEEAAAAARRAGGPDLRTFLQTVTASARDRVRVTFTGHSKGGALAPTLALWLAESQGPADPAHAWDPARKASIDCVAFAGPTAGNTAFAQRSNELIGAHCHRIVNPLDVVTKAWAVADLRAIRGLYDPAIVTPIPGFNALVDAVARVVDREQLNYTHVGNHVEPLQTALNPTQRTFVGQLVHQHLQAYLDAAGIGHVVNVGTFFNPLS